MSILLVDGVRYKPWTPKDEEKEFHPLVRKYSNKSLAIIHFILM
jgi:hypothetical protein